MPQWLPIFHRRGWTWQPIFPLTLLAIVLATHHRCSSGCPLGQLLGYLLWSLLLTILSRARRSIANISWYGLRYSTLGICNSKSRLSAEKLMSSCSFSVYDRSPRSWNPYNFKIVVSLLFDCLGRSKFAINLSSISLRTSLYL